MRRWLTIFLLLLLPMQLSWAVGTAYCKHEAGAAAQHIGHHEHQHVAEDEDASSSTVNANGIADADCGTCHAGCTSAIVDSMSLPAILLSSDIHSSRHVRISSHTPSLPERPNWADLA